MFPLTSLITLQDRDMRLYQDWKAEYVHADDCFVHPGTTRTAAYTELGVGLKTLSHQAIHSVHSLVGVEEAEGYAHIVQVRDYVQDDWFEMLAVLDQTVARNDSGKSRPGFFVDIGPMTAGLGGMTHDQYIAQFSIWCALKSPLIMGNDVATANDALLRYLLQNGEMIAVNQDSLGVAVTLVSRTLVSPLSRYNTNLVVTAPCVEGNTAQEWEIEDREPANYRRFRNPTADMCLGWEPDGTAKVSLCFESDESIRWDVKSEYNQLHPKYSQDNCLTTSTSPRVAGKIRGCGERAATRDWQGDNQWWHGFNDVTWIEVINNQTNPDTYWLRNNNNQCATIGLTEYWDIYSGPLADNRVLVLLLNRDSEAHNMRFQWTDIPGLEPSRVYFFRDVYGKRELGGFSAEFSSRVSGHSSVMLVLRESF